MSVLRFLITGIVVTISLSYICLSVFQTACVWIGWYLRQRTLQRRELLLDEAHKSVNTEVSDNGLERAKGQHVGSSEGKNRSLKSLEPHLHRDWDGVIGFFHPFCNAGGGGERVLWTSIQAVQKYWPNALCVVYTGDHDVTKEVMMERVKGRFNIPLIPAKIAFIYLSTRSYLLASTWPRFTLLGQSFGSILVACDAFSLLVPDILVDTMGYAFVLAFSKALFPKMPTGAYVHYPTISTDMLSSLGEDGQGLNAGAGKGTRGLLKKKYWEAFALMYTTVGSTIDLVVTNSTWTQNHIQQLWGERRKIKGMADSRIIYPPVAVEELEEEIKIDEEAEKARGPIILYIAQFRPEKNHTLIIRAFAKLFSSESFTARDMKLVLVGSVRDKEDATRVYQLRLLAYELKLKDKVDFICDATWPQILDWLGRSSIGVNGMWNEHFGIGIVEYQAAGLVSIVHDSGGPKQDIVVDLDGKPTGYHASDASEYAAKFAEALSLRSDEKLSMRLRARKNARRFSAAVFTSEWVSFTRQLIELYEKQQ